MGFQWLSMRISEEKDRRERQRAVLERLPGALDELHAELAACLADYAAAFGAGSASITLSDGKITIDIRDRVDGEWVSRGAIEISTVTRLPGFEVSQGGKRFEIVIGMLPGSKLFHKAGEEFLNPEDLTRRILDRVLFPKLTA